jgi:hypothetical protein
MREMHRYDAEGFVVGGVQVAGAVLCSGSVFALWSVRRLEGATLDSLALLDIVKPPPGQRHAGLGWAGLARRAACPALPCPAPPRPTLPRPSLPMWGSPGSPAEVLPSDPVVLPTCLPPRARRPLLAGRSKPEPQAFCTLGS